MNDIQGNSQNDEPDPLPEPTPKDDPKPAPSQGPIKNEPTPETAADYKKRMDARAPGES